MLINANITYTGYLAEQVARSCIVPKSLGTIVPVDISIRNLKEKFIIPLIRSRNDRYNQNTSYSRDFLPHFHQLAQQLTYHNIVIMCENDLLNNETLVRDKRNRKFSIRINTDLLRTHVLYAPIPKNNNFIRLIGILLVQFPGSCLTELEIPSDLTMGGFKKDYILPYILGNPNECCKEFALLARLRPRAISVKAIQVYYHGESIEDNDLITDISDDIRLTVLLENVTDLAHQNNLLKKRCVSLFAGYHPKLGAKSHIKCLPTNLAQEIFTLAVAAEDTQPSVVLRSVPQPQPSTFCGYRGVVLDAPRVAPVITPIAPNMAERRQLTPEEQATIDRLAGGCTQQ